MDGAHMGNDFTARSKFTPQVCALCHAAIKDSEHFWSCKHESQNQQLVEKLMIDREKVKAWRTTPSILSALLSASTPLQFTGSIDLIDPSTARSLLPYSIKAYW